MIHNFTHSFIGGCNYVDDAFIYVDLSKLVCNLNGEVLTISWIPVRTPELFKLTPRIRKSIGYYRNWLPEHSNNHGVTLDCLIEFKTEFHMALNRQVHVKSIAIDDRGKEHSCLL